MPHTTAHMHPLTHARTLVDTAIDAFLWWQARRERETALYGAAADRTQTRYETQRRRVWCRQKQLRTLYDALQRISK